jgi:hypothetical protein
MVVKDIEYSMRRSVWIIAFFFVYLVSSLSISSAATSDIRDNPFEQNFDFVVAGDFGCDDNAKQTINGMNRVGLNW